MRWRMQVSVALVALVLSACTPNTESERTLVAPSETTTAAENGGDETTTSTTTTTAAAAPTPERIEVAHDGQQNTDPFELVGGRYSVEYSLTGSCSYSGYLRAPDDRPVFESIANGSGPVDGTTNVYHVDPGTYYVRMITGPSPGCPWRIVLTRQ